MKGASVTTLGQADEFDDNTQSTRKDVDYVDG